MKVLEKATKLLKKDPILVIATLLALISILFIPIDKEYLGYIDTKVLALLFAFMVVMEGLKELGVFYELAGILTKKVKNIRQLTFVLVFLCLFYYKDEDYKKWKKSNS